MTGRGTLSDHSQAGKIMRAQRRKKVPNPSAAAALRHNPEKQIPTSGQIVSTLAALRMYGNSHVYSQTSWMDAWEDDPPTMPPEEDRPDFGRTNTSLARRRERLHAASVGQEGRSVLDTLVNTAEQRLEYILRDEVEEGEQAGRGRRYRRSETASADQRHYYDDRSMSITSRSSSLGGPGVAPHRPPWTANKAHSQFLATERLKLQRGTYSSSARSESRSGSRPGAIKRGRTAAMIPLPTSQVRYVRPDSTTTW